MAYEDPHCPELEDFHDTSWSAIKLWGLGIVTLGIAFAIILWASETAIRPM